MKDQLVLQWEKAIHIFPDPLCFPPISMDSHHQKEFIKAELDLYVIIQKRFPSKMTWQIATCLVFPNILFLFKVELLQLFLNYLCFK